MNTKMNTNENKDTEKSEDAAMRAFLKQGLAATRGISEGLLPRIKYSVNEDGSVSEEVVWVEPKRNTDEQ